MTLDRENPRLVARWPATPTSCCSSAGSSSRRWATAWRWSPFPGSCYRTTQLRAVHGRGPRAVHAALHPVRGRCRRGARSHRQARRHGRRRHRPRWPGAGGAVRGGTLHERRVRAGVPHGLRDRVLRSRADGAAARHRARSGAVARQLGAGRERAHHRDRRLFAAAGFIVSLPGHPNRIHSRRGDLRRLGGDAAGDDAGPRRPKRGGGARSGRRRGRPPLQLLGRDPRGRHLPRATTPGCAPTPRSLSRPRPASGPSTLSRSCWPSSGSTALAPLVSWRRPSPSGT